jgi:hypothetical protein
MPNSLTPSCFLSASAESGYDRLVRAGPEPFHRSALVCCSALNYTLTVPLRYFTLLQCCALLFSHKSSNLLSPFSSSPLLYVTHTSFSSSTSLEALWIPLQLPDSHVGLRPTHPCPSPRLQGLGRKNALRSGIYR